MSCSQCVGIEFKFDRKKAAQELQGYRKDGPKETTRRLIDAVIAEGVSGMTVLDIGGGIGAIQHELLKEGANSSINVEASQAYIKAAEEEAKRQGHAQRISHFHGDFVDLAGNIPECDVVTLDKVVCCYDDMRGLVEESSARARRVYGLVYYRNHWYARIWTALDNFLNMLRRHPFRQFMHPPEEVDQILRSKGFQKRFHHEVGVWLTVVYERSNPR
ncbi:MAG: methyltransferase domain-containing protein [Candidatus Thorarchaeota archaeon]|nr:MAG: methyltransferase domain-containing protein [Candidatus Thorarchaeota archaeon]